MQMPRSITVDRPAEPTSQRLAVAFPLYKQVSAAFFMNWLTMDHSNIARLYAVDYAQIAAAFRLIVENALESDTWDRLVLIEHDMIMPRNALNRIAACHRPEQAVVGAVYFEHFPPHAPFAFIKHEGRHHNLAPQTMQEWCANPALYQVDGVGFGFTSIARHVLENWNPQVPMFHTDEHFTTQDLWFCGKAQEQGHHIFLDTGIVCGHLTEAPVELADNLRCADMAGQLVEFTVT